MTPRRRPSAGAGQLASIALLALVTLVGLTTAGCESHESEQRLPAGPSISIRGQTVQLEIAETNAARNLGLGYRESLVWGHGMLFRYDEPGFPGFWMKGMRFDIDIVWLRDQRIVDISHQVRHARQGNGDQVRPRQITDMVLEVPAGYAVANGWRPGDRAILQIGD